MGLAVYQSRVAVRNFKYRLLSPEEIAVSSKEK
jgi:hypothetical protein